MRDGSMTAKSARHSLVFSCIGHSYAHLFEPIFFVVALVLPGELGLSYEAVLALVIAGKLLYGVAAPVSGWCGDRWGATPMMGVYFLGLGLSAVATGISQSPMQMATALAAVGLFGSIYHPVGIAWLVRNAESHGKALGVNGVFGGVGPALAGVLAGGLTVWLGWRSAFIIPGVVVFLTGLAFVWLLRRGEIVELKADRKASPPASRGETIRVGIILSLTLLCSGLIYQSTQPALPKLFEERMALQLGDNILGIGGAIMVVYLVAGLLQIVAGHLADRYPLRNVYILMYVAQVPLLWLAASFSGWPLLGVALLMVTFNLGGIPAENSMLARYTPAKWRGTAFGLKFILSFGVSGLGVPMVSLIRVQTGGFEWLFWILAALSLTVVALGMFLPKGEK
jgi:FSR family fosmidomycin resistance protein-like MFS transporter